jgi:trk system potassium uptake protein
MGNGQPSPGEARAKLPLPAAVMNSVLALAGLLASASLVLEYGWREPRPVALDILAAVQAAVMAAFVLDRLLRLADPRTRMAFLRGNWPDFALPAAGAIIVAVWGQALGGVLAAGALYVAVTEAYALVAVVLRGVVAELDSPGGQVDLACMLALVFVLLCAAGLGLLLLPAAMVEGVQPPLYFDQALFTATSAACLTGLTLRDTGAEMSPLGQGIILALIQAGGLLTLLAGTVLARRVGQVLAAEPPGDSREPPAPAAAPPGASGTEELARSARFAVLATFVAEAAGAVLLYPMFAAPQGAHVPSAAQAVWYSIFHSVSAFCNSGFSLLGDNLLAGAQGGWATPLRDRWQVLGVLAPLIVLGGLGMPVLRDCVRLVRHAAARLLRRSGPADAGPAGAAPGQDPQAQPQPRPRLSLHSKIVLLTTAAVIVIGTAGLLVLAYEPPPPGLERIQNLGEGREEDQARWRNLSTGDQVRLGLFQSIAARSAGFRTVDVEQDLTDAARLWLCGLMVVGGSPAGTAGGLKTATLAVLLLAGWSLIRRRDGLAAFGRSIPAILLRRAVAVAMLYLGLLAAVTILMCLAMPRTDFLKLLFEACSACGNVGLSDGLTPKLETYGKLVVTAGMLAGRAGMLAAVVALPGEARRGPGVRPLEEVAVG